jgi:hypothetical protein
MNCAALRDRLTHDLDFETVQALEVIQVMLASIEEITTILQHFGTLCLQLHLLPLPPAAS